MRHKWLIALVALFVPLMVLAQNSNAKGRGALVIVDEAPVFKESTGTEQIHTLHRLDTIVGNKSFGMGLELWDFVEKDGRVRVAYLNPEKKEKRGWVQKGWVRPADLAMFVYADCGVPAVPWGQLMVGGGGSGTGSPWPWSAAGTWTLCFQEARDAKLKELAASSPTTDKPAPEKSPD